MAKNKICFSCSKVFIARRDAKTCSSRCRKRLERQKRLLSLELIELQPKNYEPLRLAKSALKKKPAINKWRRLAAISFFFLFLWPHSNASALAEGYTTFDSGLKQGMAVELSDSSTPQQKLVQRAEASKPAKVLGVSISLDDSVVTTASSTSKVFVANSGEAKAYVSDINGVVKKGDLLSLSPLNGILMKNTDGSQGVVGIALADFPTTYQEVSYHDSTGAQQSAKIGLESINVSLVLPGASQAGQNWLGQLGRTITGRDVGPQRMAAAGIIFITLVVIEGTLVYSTVSKSLVAIGRNPLAGHMVRTQAMHSFAMAALFLLVGSSIISIILWI